MAIALFVACLNDTFHPRAGIAVVRVLEHLGHEVVFPRQQTCCGQPLFNGGEHEGARDVARHMLRAFRPYETIVTPSPSCAAMVREHYPALFAAGTAEHAEARALAARTHEFAEYLVDVLRVDLRALGVRWRGSATYHFSCHGRGTGIRAATERLMGQIDGLRLRALEHVEQCCGFGGMFSVKYPAISGTMVEDKVRCIRATGAGTVLSDDAGCTMNIAGACRRAGDTPAFKHLAEIIAEGLGLLERAGA